MERVLREGVPGRPDRRVVVYPSRSKQVLLTAGAVVFVLLGAWLITLGGLRAVAGAAAVLVFGLFGVLLARRLADPSPALVIDRDGLHDNASALGAGLIRWPEVAQVGTFTYQGQRMLGVHLHDPEALLARLDPVRRGLMRTNIRLVGTVVTIPQNALPVDVDDLIIEMRTFLLPG